MVDEQSIGQVLRLGREAKGLDIQQISSVLCIAKSYLRALEEDRFDDLPCQTYAVGFLRTYADYLGLDANELVSKVKGQADSFEPEATVLIPEVAHDGGIPNLPLMFAGAFGVIALFAFITFYGEEVIRSDQVTAPTKEILAKAQPSSALSTSSADSVIPNNSNTSDTGALAQNGAAAGQIDAQLLAQEINLDFDIVAVADTWVRLVDENNAPVIEKIVHQGERLAPTYEAGYKLSADNAGGLMVYVSGAPAYSLGDRGALLDSVSIEQIQSRQPATR